MKRQKRYMTFYQLKAKRSMPYISTYGLMCTRSWWKCFKLGMKHIAKGKAYFFTIQKAKPKKSLCSWL